MTLDGHKLFHSAFLVHIIFEQLYKSEDDEQI